MIVLGIETSCDETAVSVVEAEGDLQSFKFKVLGSAVNSQIDIHKPYGGVFPTLAKREHQKNLLPVLIEALSKAGLISNSQFSIFNEFLNNNFQSKKPVEIWDEFLGKIEKPRIDLVSVTIGPGLEPALWVGIEFARELGEQWGIPVIGANHMLGHTASVLFTENSQLSAPTFPALALLVSGGHTELVLLKNWAEKERIGQTLDDAAGEAFDKVARMLGLPYPGGPQISALAEKARNSNIENRDVKFPRPMMHSGDFNFSFSGLKTAVLYHVRKIGELSPEQKMAIAREFEDAVIETLVHKTQKAMEKYEPRTLIVGGGVVANKTLRENILKLQGSYPRLQIFMPEKSLATDNATMIAAAGFIRFLKEGVSKGELKAQGNLSIS